MRIVTLGSDHNHPLTLAAVAVVAELESVEHVDHLTANDKRVHLQAPRSSEYQSYLAGLEPDLLLSAAYARIVPPEVLAIPRIGAINVHPSLLPDYRGVSAVWWALYEGRTRIGVTIHEMTASVDTGPILAQAALEVNLDADPVTVWKELGPLARPILRETLEEIQSSRRVAGTPQPKGGSYRSLPQKEAHRLEIDWSQTADELVRRDRIFPGKANIAAGRRRIYIRRIDAAGLVAPVARECAEPAPYEYPGCDRRWRLRSPDVRASRANLDEVPATTCSQSPATHASRCHKPRSRSLRVSQMSPLGEADAVLRSIQALQRRRRKLSRT